MARKRSAPAEPADGRTLRAARNHAAIVDAMYALVRETHRPPSVEEVAARAGVGTRTIFRQFDDLETLYRSLAERIQTEVLGLVVLEPPTGRLEEDLRALVARRAKVFEHITPFRRVVRVVKHESTFIRDQDALARAAFRQLTLMVVQPHLPPDDVDAPEALDALLSFEFWDRLRDQQGLSVKRAERVLVSSALAVIAAAQRRP
jgi:AcrR family transcriptional regulator